MKKEAPTSLASDISCRIFDPSAETIEDLVAATGRGSGWIRTYTRGQVASGQWEQVWKRGTNGRPVPAYRRAK